MSAVQDRLAHYECVSIRWRFKSTHDCRLGFYRHGSYAAQVKDVMGDMCFYHLKKNDDFIIQGECWDSDEAYRIVEDKLVELGLLYRPNEDS